MGLLDEMRSEATRAPGTCSVAVLLDELPATDKADLIAALDDAAIPHTVIARVLTSRGHNMHAKRIANHRRGDCACSR